MFSCLFFYLFLFVWFCLVFVLGLYIFFSFLLLVVFFVICLEFSLTVGFFCFPLFFPLAMLCGLPGFGPQAGGQAWASGVGTLSPGCWTTREHQVPGNVNQCELSWRSPSRNKDPAPPNCLKAPVLDSSGQTARKTGTEHHPSADRKHKVVLSSQTP